MRINSINNQNVNFNGTVDKSVINYLREVRYDALNKPNAFFKPSGKNATVETYNEVKVMIENIMTKLNNFMAKTHSKTKILLNDDFYDKRDIYFENTKLDSKNIGAYFWLNGTEEEYGTTDNKGRILLKDPKLKNFSRDSSHTLKELVNFNKYTVELTENFKPEEIDGALFDTKVTDVVEKAKETAPKSRLQNRTAFYMLDKLSSEFHHEPIYTEMFHQIQEEAYKREEADKPIEIAKEELKNFKI